jgi:hypothetical protein
MLLTVKYVEKLPGYKEGVAHLIFERTRQKKRILIPVLVFGKLYGECLDLKVGLRYDLQVYISGKIYMGKVYTDVILEKIRQYVPKAERFARIYSKDTGEELFKKKNTF